MKWSIVTSVKRSDGAYITCIMCIRMVILVGVTGKSWRTSLGLLLMVPSRFPSMLMNISEKSSIHSPARWVCVPRTFMERTSMSISSSRPIFVRSGRGSSACVGTAAPPTITTNKSNSWQMAPTCGRQLIASTAARGAGYDRIPATLNAR